MSIPKDFKAATVPEKGAQHTISTRSLAPLEAGEVGIKITATAINPVDWKMRDYGVFIKSYPTILGSDGAGEIVELGSGVSGADFAAGDRVFFQGIIGNLDSATFQQYCKMPATLVSHAPRNLSDVQGAGICVTSVAAVVGFYDKAGRGLPAPWDEGGDRVGKGKAVVVLGGSSSVGQYAIQLARLSGFERIVTNCGAAHRDFLQSLGAHVALDRAVTGAEDFRAAIGDLPLEFVFDGVSVKASQRLGVEILQATRTEGSRVVTVQMPDAEAKELGQSGETKVEIASVLGLGSAPHLRYLSEPLAKHLGGEDGWIAKGLFIPNRVDVVEGGLGALEKALEKNKQGVSGQKVIIRPWDI